MYIGVGIRRSELSRYASTSTSTSTSDYGLRLKAAANDTVFLVRDSAANADWKRAHEELVRLARERAGLDWEEGCWLLSALRSQAHRKIGCGTFEEYVERLFGYSPRFTKEKVRVAEALEALTEMAQALKDGEISWSALRELTRVATPRTEGEWLSAARRRSVRQIERLVSGRKRGDRPDDPADEANRRHVIRLEVTAATYATFREMSAKVRRDAGEPLDDDAVVLMMARTVLGGPKDAGRSSYQIKLDVCEKCRRGVQEGRGELVEVAPEVVEMAECDAQHLGVIPSRADVHVEPSSEQPESGGKSDVHVGSSAHRPESGPKRDPHVAPSAEQPEPSPKPRRAKQSIPPAMRRWVMRRDRSCCVVPGCKSSTFLDAHHLTPREEGGDHDVDRLVTLCGAHHRAVHDGRIVIEGLASERLAFFHADGTPYGGAVSPAVIELKTQAFQALRNLGFKESETRRTLDAIDLHHVGVTLESVVRQALAMLT